MCAERFLDFHPEYDGFQFKNGFLPLKEDREFIVRELKATGDQALAVAGLILYPDPIALLVAYISGAGEKIVESCVRLHSDQDEYGMCGGMCHAATDYWMKGLNIPGIDRAPAEPGATSSADELTLRRYIRQRLADTLRPHLVKFILKWSATALSRGRHPYMPFHADLVKEVHQIGRKIDRGRPVTVGIIGDSANPFDMHQVLCYGYKANRSRTNWLLLVYDPNARGQNKWIKAKLECPSEGSLITTNIALPRGTPNWLSYIFPIDYEAKDPPPTRLFADNLELFSLDGRSGLHFNSLTAVTADLCYQGAGACLPFLPEVSCSSRQRGQTDRRRLKPLSPVPPVSPRAGQPYPVSFKVELPEGEHQISLGAVWRTTSPPSSEQSPYERRQRLAQASGAKLRQDAIVFGRPSIGSVSFEASGSNPAHGGDGTLEYRLEAHAEDDLGRGASYEWQVRANNANARISGTGRTATVEAGVRVADETPAIVTAELKGVDSQGAESRGAGSLELPRATARVFARPSKIWGPDVRVGDAWRTYGTRQGYLEVVLEVHWRYFAGRPDIRLAHTHSSTVFCPPPDAELEDSWNCPIWMFPEGTDSYGIVTPDDPPQPVLVSLRLKDEAGQELSFARQIEAFYQPDHFRPPEEKTVVETVEKEKGPVAPRLSPSVERVFGYSAAVGELQDVERLEQLASLAEKGAFGDLLLKHREGVTGSHPLFEELAVDQPVFYVAAPTHYELVQEADLDIEILEGWEPRTFDDDLSTVGRVRLTPAGVTELVPD